MKKKMFSLFLVFIMIMSLMPIVQIKDSNASVGASINKKSVKLFVNQKYQLKLSGTKLTKIASSNKKVVIVNSKGLIKGVKAGKATVSLKGSNNKVYKCSVTVKNPYINKTSISLIKGKSYTLKLYRTSIKSVATSNKKVAIISKNGVVKGLEKGSCYVYIKGTNNKVYKCKVAVKETYINKPFMTIAKGKTEKITLYNAKIKSVFTKNSKIAIISKTGIVKGISEGKTTIYIIDNYNIKHESEITVKDTKGIHLSKTSITLKIGQKYQLKLLKTDKKPKWTSDHYSIISYNNGIVEGRFPGTTYAYAILDDVKYACKVKVLSRQDYNSSCKHNWKLIIHNNGTCNMVEYFQYKCSKCNKTKTEYGPKIDHIFRYFWTYEPTCIEKGFDKYVCEYCGRQIKTNFTPKVEHSWKDPITTKIYENGEWVIHYLYYCKWCSESYID